MIPTTMELLLVGRLEMDQVQTIEILLLTPFQVLVVMLFTCTITDNFGCVGSSTLIDAVCVYASPIADFSGSSSKVRELSREIFLMIND
jgi:hypothetical protein